MHANRWVFFDLGWTLVDETEAHLERFGRLRSLGRPYSEVRDAEYLDLCEAHSAHFAPSPFLATLRTLDPEGWESATHHTTYSHASERTEAERPDRTIALIGDLSCALIGP